MHVLQLSFPAHKSPFWLVPPFFSPLSGIAGAASEREPESRIQFGRWKFEKFQHKLGIRKRMVGWGGGGGGEKDQKIFEF